MPHEISQLIVIGRGRDPDMPTGLSSASYDRAIAASRYCAKNNSVEHVIFSSGFSSLSSVESAERLDSEARLMASAADLPQSLHVVLEERSTNTFENFLFSAQLLEADSVTGVLAHAAHLPRALLIARRVLGMPVAGISAESLGARAESRQSACIEKLQLTWMGGLLLGVGAGDLKALHERNKLDQRIKRLPANGLKTACRILRQPLPQQYQ